MTKVLPRDAATDVRVAIWLTPILAGFYEAHGLFPELLAMEPARMVSKTRIIAAPIALGERVLKDAEQRYQNRLLLPRGMAVSFSALIDRLRQEIKAASGLWDDPGMAEAIRRQQEEFARFKVGERVRLDTTGYPFKIIEEYGYCSARDNKNGAYITPEGDRINYRQGYVVKDEDGGGQWFYPPGALRTWDDKPGHLRLVWSNPNPV